LPNQETNDDCFLSDENGAPHSPNLAWLVVLTILKNMKVSWDGLSHKLWKMKNA
jgi:hypothetical protein